VSESGAGDPVASIYGFFYSAMGTINGIFHVVAGSTQEVSVKLRSWQDQGDETLDTGTKESGSTHPKSMLVRELRQKMELNSHLPKFPRTHETHTPIGNHVMRMLSRTSSIVRNNKLWRKAICWSSFNAQINAQSSSTKAARTMWKVKHRWEGNSNCLRRSRIPSGERGISEEDSYVSSTHSNCSEQTSFHTFMSMFVTSDSLTEIRFLWCEQPSWTKDSQLA